MLLVIQKGSREAGFERVGRGNEWAVFFYVYEERKKRRERGREIKGRGRERGGVNSEVRSSSPRRRFRPRLPGFLMSTAKKNNNKKTSVNWG